MVMKPYGMWNWITNKCSIPPSSPFFFSIHNPPALSLYLSPSLSFASPMSLSSNKAAILNWNSMLSRSAHLIYKIKLKASHAWMAFCDDNEGRQLFQLHTIIFLSCDLLVAGGDTFFLSPAMMCQMPHLKPWNECILGYELVLFVSVKPYLCYGSFFNTCYKVAKHGSRLMPCHRHSEIIYHTLD